MVDRPVEVHGLTIVRVSNARRALGDLSRHVRRQNPIPIAAITGSNGKTTTKDFCASICAQAGSTLSTQGNLNNDIGLPLTILGLDSQHRFGVVEMGMNAPGEIAYLAEIVRPEVGVITNIAPAHLGKLGSMGAIARAKGELFHGLARDGIAVRPGDEALLESECAHIPRNRQICFGDGPKDDVRLLALQRSDRAHQRLDIALCGKAIVAQIALPGPHNARNALAAAAAAVAMGIDAHTIVEGLRDAHFSPHRSRWIDVHGMQILDDCYNANPASTIAALHVAREAATQVRLVAVLGDMLELGEQAPRLHQEVGSYAARHQVDFLVCVGELAECIAEGAISGGLDAARTLRTKDPEMAARAVRAAARSGDVVLVKGSRGARMERVLQHLMGEG